MPNSPAASRSARLAAWSAGLVMIAGAAMAQQPGGGVPTPPLPPPPQSVPQPAPLPPPVPAQVKDAQVKDAQGKDAQGKNAQGASDAKGESAIPQAKASSQAEAEGREEAALVEACKTHALTVLKQRSPSVDDIFIDMDGLTIAKAELAVEDTKVRAVLMGEAYIQRDRSDKAHRFLCLAGDRGQVLLTFFTLR